MDKAFIIAHKKGTCCYASCYSGNGSSAAGAGGGGAAVLIVMMAVVVVVIVVLAILAVPVVLIVMVAMVAGVTGGEGSEDAVAFSMWRRRTRDTDRGSSLHCACGPVGHRGELDMGMAAA